MVTDVERYGVWRSDLSKSEVLDENHFAEYTKDGYVTDFVVTAKEFCKRWEFDMDNSNMSGHWTGIFTTSSHGTTVEFIEEVCAKKFFIKPFISQYVKKQQDLFVEDLKKALEQ